MSPELLFLLCLLLTAGALTVGIVFIHRGKKENLRGLMIAGWIMVGVLSLLATGGIIFLAVETSWMIGFLFVILPLLIIVGLITTLAYGISNLASGYHKDKDGNVDIVKIKVGWINLGINLTVTTLIVVSIIVLLILFMTGTIAIRFM